MGEAKGLLAENFKPSGGPDGGASERAFGTRLF
jgi:hypothetical protein